MVDKILKASGIPYRQGRYPNPPAGTYAVYFDDHEVDGPDAVGEAAPRIVRHDLMVELYEPKPDPDAEAALEAALNARGILWAKDDRNWLQNVQRYQVVYDFYFIEKVRT